MNTSHRSGPANTIIDQVSGPETYFLDVLHLRVWPRRTKPTESQSSWNESHLRAGSAPFSQRRSERPGLNYNHDGFVNARNLPN